MVNQSTPHTVTDEKASWIPMITIALAQILMSFNVASALLNKSNF